MGTFPKHVAPLTTLKRQLRTDRLTFVETPDMYRGTVAGGVATNGDIGTWLAGDELGASAGGAPDAFKGTIGQSLSAAAPLYVKYPQSLIFYATALSAPAATASVTIQITGYDWWGNPITESMALLTTNLTTQAKPTQFVYARVTSIKLVSNTGTLSDTGFIAIGHGKSLVNTSVLFRPRIIVSPQLCQPQIQGVPAASAPCGLLGLNGIAKILDPNGLPIVLTTNTGANQQWDAAKGGVTLPDATALVAGEYTVHYAEGWLETA